MFNDNSNNRKTIWFKDGSNQTENIVPLNPSYTAGAADNNIGRQTDIDKILNSKKNLIIISSQRENGSTSVLLSLKKHYENQGHRVFWKDLRVNINTNTDFSNYSVLILDECISTAGFNGKDKNFLANLVEDFVNNDKKVILRTHLRDTGNFYESLKKLKSKTLTYNLGKIEYKDLKAIIDEQLTLIKYDKNRDYIYDLLEIIHKNFTRLGTILIIFTKLFEHKQTSINLEKLNNACKKIGEKYKERQEEDYDLNAIDVYEEINHSLTNPENNPGTDKALEKAKQTTLKKPAEIKTVDFNSTGKITDNIMYRVNNYKLEIFVKELKDIIKYYIDKNFWIAGSNSMANILSTEIYKSGKMQKYVEQKKIDCNNRKIKFCRDLAELNFIIDNCSTAEQKIIFERYLFIYEKDEIRLNVEAFIPNFYDCNLEADTVHISRLDEGGYCFTTNSTYLTPEETVYVKTKDGIKVIQRLIEYINKFKGN